MYGITRNSVRFPLAIRVASSVDLDFRQLMKAIGGIRGQMSQLQVTVKEVSDNQGAVQQVAEVSLFPHCFQAFSALCCCYKKLF